MLLLTLAAALSLQAAPAASPEAKIVEYLKANVKPGQRVVVSELYNNVFTAPAERAALKDYAACFGQAFQLADDLLDAEGDAEALGKAVAKDEGRGKATLVALLGVEAARRRLQTLLQEAEQALAPFGERAITLIETVRFAVNRTR